MSEQSERRRRYFNAGVEAILEANETEVVPRTKPEGVVTVAWIIVVVLTVLVFILGVFVDSDFHYLSAVGVVICAILATRMIISARTQLQEIHDERAKMIYQKREEYAQTNKVETYYVLQFRAPDMDGKGTVAKVFSAANPTFDEIAAWWPDIFEEPGFYTLVCATGKTKTVD